MPTFALTSVVIITTLYAYMHFTIMWGWYSDNNTGSGVGTSGGGKEGVDAAYASAASVEGAESEPEAAVVVVAEL
jgi:hypothetical protein